MKKALVTITLTLCTIITCTAAITIGKGEFKSYYKGLPFSAQTVTRPSIPDLSVSVTEFGGNGNGTADNTAAFKAAVDYLSSKGGGHLLVPAGIWYTGPIELKSHIDLHVYRDAIILFNPDRSLYPVINTSFEGLETRRCESPIHADGQTDVSITGGGVIDGSGHSWRAVKKSKLTASEWKAKVASGGIVENDVWYPDEGFLKASRNADMNVPDPSLDEKEIISFLRPVMISFRNCTNVLLEDCLFQNSPAWNIHPLLCKNVIIKGITVRNPSYSQNGDGIDIESCTDVLLIDSSFDCGDDGICVKSGKDADGRRRGVPTSNLIVDGCTVYHGHGGFVVGSEMSGGVNNVKVSNCRFLGTDVGLRFKSKRGRGGVVENIWIDHIYMTDIVTETILFDLHYSGKSAVEAAKDGSNAPGAEIFPVDETTPAFRHIHISDVVCNGAARAMYFNGIPEMPVEDINIKNCTIKADKGIEMHYVKDVNIDWKTTKIECPSLALNVVRSEMKRCPQASYLDGQKGTLKWNYTTGLELKAFLDTYDAHPDNAVLMYVDDWYNSIIADDGSIGANYKTTNYTLDHICPGRTLFRLYELTGREKYRKAQDALYTQLTSQPRTKAGPFWHKKAYPYQVWLDGLYMAEPFYAEYAGRYLKGDAQAAAYADITDQFLTAAHKTWDPQTGLYRHAWDESREMFWCNPENGQSAHCWGRALGWYTMALAEVLPLIPATTPGRKEMEEVFKGILSTLPKYADPETGMWYQVLDSPGKEGNYTEATCSAMFTYAQLKAAKMGLINADTAKANYDKLLKTFVSQADGGLITLDRCCAVAGLGGKENRSGSYEYYINEKICSNDPKGIGPLIWAALEMEK